MEKDAKDPHDHKFVPPRKQKEWPKKRGENAWTMFKVMAEFVDGFEVLNSVGPCVSIFGSARTPEDHPYYALTEDIARVTALLQTEQARQECLRPAGDSDAD